METWISLAVGFVCLILVILGEVAQRRRRRQTQPLITLRARIGAVSDEEFAAMQRSADGKLWADAFCRMAGIQDDGWVLSWFCNAIMAGWDHGRRRLELEALERCSSCEGIGGLPPRGHCMRPMEGHGPYRRLLEEASRPAGIDAAAYRRDAAAAAERSREAE